MAKRLVVLAHLLLLSVALLSCASAEQSILITARVSGTNATVIENVAVLILQTEGTAVPIDRQTNPVNRTVQDINGEEPIRIGVRLMSPTPVMIYMRATAGAQMFYGTRCYVPNGVLRDEVLLVALDATEDMDGDGWPSAAHVDASCRDPGAGATGVACDIGQCTAAEAGDCNDTPSTMTGINCTDVAMRGNSVCIHPGAAASCGDGIDQDCRANGLPFGSLDEPCEDADGDGVDLCGPAGGVCDCDDTDPTIHPGAVDICGDGIDQDCSREAGGRGAPCDLDGDGYPGGDHQPDCNDNDPNIHPGGLALEHCDSNPVGGMCGVACRLVGTDCMCDGVDNNCNGLTDEDASCRSPDLDGDGSHACGPGVTDCASCDCNDCDSGIHPLAHNICGNRIDEDGIGGDPLTTGDPMCAADDTDGDGFTGGQDCNEGDAQIHLDAPENCTNAVSESCNTMTCPPRLDMDSDGFEAATVGGTDCNDSVMGGAAVNPWAMESCNGVDDDCDGTADEVLDPMDLTGCMTDDSCMGGGRCSVQFDHSIHNCGGCRHECNAGTTIVADGCAANTCMCSTNAGPGQPACAVGSTCCGLMYGMVGDMHPNPHSGCYDTNTSTDNCGGCGNICDRSIADACVGGRCECGTTGAACGAGQTCCNGACVNEASDVNNCGACMHACGARTSCNAGTCGCDNPTTHGDCNGDIGSPSGNGCETDLQTDAHFCGTCGVSCLDEHVATGTCSGGVCAIGTCETLYGDCTGGATNGCETDLSTVAHCGSCATSCSAMHADTQCMVSGSTASCGYGTCQPLWGDCEPDRTNGCERSLTQTTSCGGCSTDCNAIVQHATPMCTGGGACDYAAGSCTAGSSDCNPSRADGCELWAPTHCGAACTNCTSAIQNATGASCNGSGTCAYGGCTAGSSDCDANPANGCEPFATSHCGAGCTDCGSYAHTMGQSCAGGACAFSCAGGFTDCDGSATPGCERAQDSSHCGTGCTDCTGQPRVMSSMCSSGACSVTACVGGFADCTGAPGCETGEDNTHCGTSCQNCNMQPHTTAGTCMSGACDVTTCQVGFADCNAGAAGCETADSPAHCGSNCTVCNSTVMNVGAATCTAGACGYSGGCTGNACDQNGMAGDGCEGTQSPAACGPTCSTNCSPGTFQHASAGCASNMCTITACQGGGWANCDGTISNGCEVMTNHNAAECCGMACGGSTSCTGNAIAGYHCT